MFVVVFIDMLMMITKITMVIEGNGRTGDLVNKAREREEEKEIDFSLQIQCARKAS